MVVVFYHFDEQVEEVDYSSKQEVVAVFLMKQISHLDVEHVSGKVEAGEVVESF